MEEEQNKAFDKVMVAQDSRPPVKQIKDGGNNDKTRTQDTLCGAARENDSQTSKLAARENDSQISQLATRENDSQFLGFSDDPIKEPDFLGYYRSYQKTQGKEIKNVASYVATILSKKDEGSSEVELLFKEWQVACRTVGRKINNFADNPEQIERQRQKFGFEGWKEWKHHAYYDRLLSEGLAKFRTHEVSARWYEWAQAKNLYQFAEIPM